MTSDAGTLPTRFAIFPLAGALLLPGTSLPLNIFEPRYLQMTRDAMGDHKVIGMVQPCDDDSAEPRPVYRTGCAGRITQFAETDDGRYMLNLEGACRFDIVEELAVTTPYRQVVASFDRWIGDRQTAEPGADLGAGLHDTLRRYFERHDIKADWQAIERAPLGGLVSSLSMICPFEPSEKQALLEAVSLERQIEILTTLLTMQSSDSWAGSDERRH